jgi:pimeloyl-ACP methyl ester carboxylesterase
MLLFVVPGRIAEQFHRGWCRIKKVKPISLMLVLACLISSSGTGCRSRIAGQPSRHERQEMIDIGRRRLFLNCSGNPHSPRVIFEAGSEATSESWARVQPKVSEFAYACSYDRAGLGKSDSAGHEETVAENVADLHELLGRAGIVQPYVLVGHSSGGIRVRRYQSQFKDEVIGIVLVDSAHEEQIWRLNKVVPGFVRGVPADPANLPRLGMLPPREHLRWRVDIPVVVLEHGKPMELPPELAAEGQIIEETLHAMQQDLASRSAKGELRMARQSGHDIPNEEPKAVAQAIADVIAESGYATPR